MNQPTKEMITEKLQLVLSGKITREELGNWAEECMREEIYGWSSFDDIDAWHYLVELSLLCEMIEPDKYLYAYDDIRDTINKYTK